MNCFLCQQPISYILTVNEYDIFECFNCHHRMTKTKAPDTHVSDIYSNEYFYGGGAGYPNYLEEKEILIQHGRRYGKILSKYIKQPGSVLDVGAAAGFILKGLIDSGWKGYGIEPNDNMAAYARNKLGLDVQTNRVESFQPQKRFDLICFIQVIAHLVEPDKAIQISSKWLLENRLILIETWNYKSLTARLFANHWHEYSPPSVLHWFSPVSLNLLMKRFGFKLLSTGRPSKKIIWKHARSLLQYKFMKISFFSLIKPFLHIVSDHILLPYPAEDLFWSLFKKV